MSDHQEKTNGILSDAPKRRQRVGDGRGGFFAIDRRAWRLACSVGLNAAVAYLTLARGTGGDNRTTKWSANSISSRTSISRARASTAIKVLATAGLIQRDPSSKPDRPKYRLVEAERVPGCPGVPPQAPAAYPAVLTALGDEWVSPPMVTTDKKRWGTITPRGDIEAMVRSGHVEASSDRKHFRVKWFDLPALSRPIWIWLPNEVVDGAAEEVPPLELLRQSADVRLLRMFVELYAAQNLAENGGVHFRIIRQQYSRYRIGERGNLVIWGFRRGAFTFFLEKIEFASHYGLSHGTAETADHEKALAAFQKAWKLLESLGLIELVSHLVNADTDEGEVLWPCPVGETGLLVERELAVAAKITAVALMTPRQLEWAATNGLLAIVPIQRHIDQLQLVGIARLRYRPRTAVTLEFMAQEPRWRAIIDGFYHLPEADTSRADQDMIKG